MSKPALSGRVMGMKFMQRAAEQKRVQKAEEEQEVGAPCQWFAVNMRWKLQYMTISLAVALQAAKELAAEALPTSCPAVADEKPVTQSDSSVKGGKCRIIYESAPATASIGRMTFSACSPTAAAGAAAAEAAAVKLMRQKKSTEVKEDQPEQVVSDTEMARAFLRGPAAAVPEASKKKKAKLK